jgi:glycosyltransferase involved in cell wall biosynthesis
MRRLCIVHFQPLEKYPPIVNLLRYLPGEIGTDCQIETLTTGTHQFYWSLDVPGITIRRIVWWKSSAGRIRRAWQYFLFNLVSLIHLCRMRPDVILYYETLSAFAPWFYKKWLRKRTPVFIHYHEYTTSAEYQNGMLLNRMLYKKELSLYRDAWVSHTNSTRMDLFIKDVGAFAPAHRQILPNYPSAWWEQTARKVNRSVDGRIGFVYVGALSMESMYTRELASFIAAHPNSCYWDIYSDNHQLDARLFLEGLNAENIRFKGSVQYDELPIILPTYDIGVIIYNGSTANYVYNAPNKLFEYLACGLNVWYPVVMEGVKPYDQQEVKPWVKAVDFNNLQLPDGEVARRTEFLPEQPYTAESIYRLLLETMKIAERAG